MQVLIGIFSVTALAMAVMIAIKLLGSSGRRFDDEATGRESRDREGDFLFIFTPLLIFLAQKGVFSGTSKAYYTTVYVGKAAARESVGWLRRHTARLAKDFAEKVEERRHPLHQKGPASFYLKDIAEHKKKVASEGREAEYEIYEGEQEHT